MASCAFLIAGLVALPIITVALNVLQPTSEVWHHLAATVIPRYLVSTFWLATGVGIGTTAIGVGAAWLVVTYRFPGRRIVEWALILPLAMPTYVLAYVYYDLLSVAGPLQGALRDFTGWGARDYWFPDVSSLPGAIVLLTLALYPYVYLPARAAFLQQAGMTLEVGRMLGCTQAGAFFRIMLPLARPAVAIGVALALMETLAEFGAVSLLGVQTFTTGIYKAWFSMGDRVAASQLAVMLLAFVFLLVWLERASRRGRTFNPSSEHHWRGRERLRGGRGALALLACLIPISAGFLIPCASLLAMVMDEPWRLVRPHFAGLIANSLMLAAITAGLALIAALIVVYGARLAQSRAVGAAARLAAMGYAIPGPVIAIGVLLPLAAFDNLVDGWMRATFGISTGLLLTGSIAALVFAYLVRFMTISIGAVEAGLTKIRPSLEDAASTLGTTPLTRLLRIHIPLIWPSLATAGLVVFVDVMKELPATLVLRPFDFDTLAIEVYDLARDERLAEAAAPAIVLVLAGLLPVILLSRQVRRGAGGGQRG